MAEKRRIEIANYMISNVLHAEYNPTQPPADRSAAGPRSVPEKVLITSRIGRRAVFDLALVNQFAALETRSEFRAVVWCTQQ